MQVSSQAYIDKLLTAISIDSVSAAVVDLNMQAVRCIEENNPKQALLQLKKSEKMVVNLMREEGDVKLHQRLLTLVVHNLSAFNFKIGRCHVAYKYMEKVYAIESVGGVSMSVYTNYLLAMIHVKMFDHKSALYHGIQAYKFLKDYSSGVDSDSIIHHLDLFRMMPSAFDVSLISPVFPFLYHSILFTVVNILLHQTMYDDALEFATEGLDTSDGIIHEEFKKIVTRVVDYQSARYKREENSKLRGN